MSVQRLSASERSARLDAAVNALIAKGYSTVDLRNTTATLKRGKRWNWIAFILWTVLSAFLLFWVYPLYYLIWAKGEIIELDVDAVGNVKGTKRKAG